ncbi:MAG: phospho-N-acetylmuramoyl-pentapeptide-transferase [Alphaproteobacteria bacterium CG_4_10_14_0_2_um_filter_63_37]|nr:MAG: phospho-N-acetylmuramoyl-pentapeptide-transferase [Proteobacteria bacterium CG1_02_64_396]PJA24596.1 MAG: phospho-N-acetylmuramoyl-pentapeptide-transferase [Alphaproteobacteria bacterium CG_4_10_14_0_2_um_filter_63_37]
MIYHLAMAFQDQISGLNLFRYITFRAIGALLTGLVIALALGPATIRRLALWQGKGQPIRTDGPPAHLLKSGTPTMGGLLILLAMVMASLLWAEWTNPLVWVVLLTTAGFAAIGYWDDYLKLIRRDPNGMPSRYKFLLQLIVALIAAMALSALGMADRAGGDLVIPFLKTVHWDLGAWWIPFVVLVVVGTANAVNLTDGQDGLAIGPAMVAAVVLAAIVYLSGHAKFSEYLLLPYVPGAGEIAVILSSLTGAGLGFLWFNAYPAQVFMGDIGALAIGGLLAVAAVVVGQELLLLLLGGIFVVEALSVMVQVASFKLRGKRVLRMAPIHHHFELKGWAEPKITVRFWIISIVLGLLALATLKVR